MSLAVGRASGSTHRHCSIRLLTSSGQSFGTLHMRQHAAHILAVGHVGDINLDTVMQLLADLTTDLLMHLQFTQPRMGLIDHRSL